MSIYSDSHGNPVTLADVRDDSDICYPGTHVSKFHAQETGDVCCARCGADMERDEEESQFPVAYWTALLADEKGGE